MNNRGVTLVELVVVVSVIAILAIAMGFSYVTWQGAYRAEKAVKDLSTDLMEARDTAMTQGRMCFADFNFPAAPPGRGTYRIACEDDTNADAEGDIDENGQIDAGAGHIFMQSINPKTIDFPITFSGGATIINFGKDGIIERRDHPPAETIWTICLTTPQVAGVTVNSDYDCLRLSQTRINMGKLTTQISDGGLCDADNCVAK